MPQQPGTQGPPPAQAGGMYNPFDINNLFVPMAQQIDMQTAGQIDQLKEQFGAEGMRWSTPMMKQMSGANVAAAQQKNQLFSDLMYNEAGNAFNRQMQTAQMAADREKQFHGQRMDAGNLALQQAGLQQQGFLGGGNLALNNAQLNMGQQNQDRAHQMDLMNSLFSQGQSRAELGLRLGEAQQGRDMEMAQLLHGMGMDVNKMSQDDLDRLYNDWGRQTTGVFDLIGRFVTPGYQSDFARNPGTMEKLGPYISALAALLG